MFSVISWSLTEDLMTCEAATERNYLFNRVHTRTVMGASRPLIHFDAAPATVIVVQTTLLLGSLNISFHVSKQHVLINLDLRQSFKAAESSTLIGHIFNFHKSRARLFVPCFLHSDLHMFLRKIDK